MTTQDQIDQYRMASAVTRGANRLKDATLHELVCAILPYFADAGTVADWYEIKEAVLDELEASAGKRLAQLEEGATSGETDREVCEEASRSDRADDARAINAEGRMR